MHVSRWVLSQRSTRKENATGKIYAVRELLCAHCKYSSCSWAVQSSSEALEGEIMWIWAFCHGLSGNSKIPLILQGAINNVEQPQFYNLLSDVMSWDTSSWHNEQSEDVSLEYLSLHFGHLGLIHAQNIVLWIYWQCRLKKNVGGHPWWNYCHSPMISSYRCEWSLAEQWTSCNCSSYFTSSYAEKIKVV